MEILNTPLSVLLLYSNAHLNSLDASLPGSLGPSHDIGKVECALEFNRPRPFRCSSISLFDMQSNTFFLVTLGMYRSATPNDGRRHDVQNGRQHDVRSARLHRPPDERSQEALYLPK